MLLSSALLVLVPIGIPGGREGSKQWQLQSMAATGVSCRKFQWASHKTRLRVYPAGIVLPTPLPFSFLFSFCLDVANASAKFCLTEMGSLKISFLLPVLNKSYC